MRRLLLFLLSALSLCPAVALAQDIRKENSVGSSGRAFRTAAETQNQTDWPIKSLGRPGTAVRFTFDASNADITVLTDKSYGQDRLLATLQKLAQDLGYPQADFIRFPDTDSATSVDMELNDYLQHPAPRTTVLDLDLSRIAALLDASDLPKPIYLGIRANHSQLNAARLQSGQETRPLKEVVFIKPGTLAPQSRLLWRAEVHWSGYIFLVFTLGMIGMVLFLPWRTLTRPTPPAPNPSPEEVQQSYDKSRPFSWYLLLPVLLLIAMVTGNLTRAMESMLFLLPSQGAMLLTLVMMGGMVLSTGGAFLVRRLRQKRGDEAPAPLDPAAPPLWTKTGFLVALLPTVLLMMGLVVLLPFWNPLRSLPPELRRTAIYWFPPTLVVLGFLPAVLVGLRAHKLTRKNLSPGEPWYDRTMALAEKAGVRVKHVVEVWSEAPNAYASIFGTVGLTRGLLQKLEPEEIDCVVAHELGHHIGGHPRRNFWITVGFTVGAIALWSALQSYIEGHFHLSNEQKALLNSPLFAIFVLPFVRSFLLGRGQRARELAADRFAVDAVGDPELVIRALTKIHDLSYSPHRLKPSDEALQTHPSLEHRIQAIREYAQSRSD